MKDETSRPAWVDEDDEQSTVALALKKSLRKLRKTDDETIVSAAELGERLRQRYGLHLRMISPENSDMEFSYEKVHPVPSWAKAIAKDDEPALLRRAGKLTASDRLLSSDQLAFSRLADLPSEAEVRPVVYFCGRVAFVTRAFCRQRYRAHGSIQTVSCS